MHLSVVGQQKFQRELKAVCKDLRFSAVGKTIKKIFPSNTENIIQHQIMMAEIAWLKSL